MKFFEWYILCREVEKLSGRHPVMWTYYSEDPKERKLNINIWKTLILANEDLRADESIYFSPLGWKKSLDHPILVKELGQEAIPYYKEILNYFILVFEKYNLPEVIETKIYKQFKDGKY